MTKRSGYTCAGAMAPADDRNEPDHDASENAKAGAVAWKAITDGEVVNALTEARLDDIADNVARCADALERIADVLEKLTAPRPPMRIELGGESE